MMNRIWIGVFLGLLAAALGAQEATVPVAAAPAAIERIAMTGSDSMDPLIRLWIAEFEKLHPQIQFKVDSKGSGTAPPALTAGETRLGHMSREMTGPEQAAFQARRGYPITHLVVAFDALGIYVNRSNPLRRIALGQLDGIYSTTRMSGWDKPLLKWGDLGVAGSWRKRDIHCFGRDEKSGTRAFFDEKVLGKGGLLRAGYRSRDQWGVVEGVAGDVAGIGYGPTNYANPEVRMLPVLAWSGMYYLPSVENILNGRYPLTRKLNLYLAKEPGQQMPAATLAFLRFILGAQGQRLVGEYGSVAIPKTLVDSQLQALER